MAKFPGAEEFVPAKGSLGELRAAEQECRGCDLYLNATRAVGGEGPARAHIMLVGEQPGDKEDRSGRPFVGPAGELLNQALADAGIEREDVFVTNAVKHFKFEERGKRRIHKKPSVGETEACKPWLWAELARVKPAIIVCMGATAAHSVIGKSHRLLEQRGQFLEHAMAPLVTATIHPSAILRAPDAETRRADYDAFVDDLKAVKRERDKIVKRSTA